MSAALVLAAALAWPAPPPVVFDAVISVQSQDVNQGRAGLAPVGPGLALLVRHGAFDLETGPGRRISAGSLVLPILDGTPRLRSVRRLLKPWREGGGWPGTPEVDGRGATWKAAGDGLRWDQPGAAGPRDAVDVPGWQVRQEGSLLRIEGLGPALEAMRRDPASDHGFRLEFETPGTLRADAVGFGPGPRWELESEPAPAGPNLAIASLRRMTPEGLWTAEVRNIGSEAAPASELVWVQNGRTLGGSPLPPLAPGGATQVSMQAPPAQGLPDETRLWVRIEGPSEVRSATVFPGGIPTAGPIGFAELDRLNRVELPLSRSGLAREGVRERFHLAAEGIEADSAQALIAAASGWRGSAESGRPGPGLTLDTRDDLYAFPGLPMTPAGWAPRLGPTGELPPSGLLGRWEIGILDALAGRRGAERRPVAPAPISLLAAFFDHTGRPLDPGPIRLLDGFGRALWSGQVSGQGRALLTAREMPEGRLIPADADPRAEWRFSWTGGEARLSLARRWEEASRTPGGVANLEFRVALPEAADLATDLAEGRSVQDSLGRFPAQLASLTGGSGDPVSTPVSSDAGFWIEVDLGRDRQVAGITLEFDGQPWEGFAAAAYGTSQSPAQARPWVRVESASAAGLAGPEGRIVLSGAATPMRYVRFSVTQAAAARLKRIRIHPPRL